LYKVDEGEWLEYNGPVTLDYGKVIYAKSILPSGKDSDIASYTSVLPSDAMGFAAYDGDASTFVSVGKTLKLLIDNNMQGRNVSIKSWVSCGWCYSSFYFYDDSNTLLSTQSIQGSNTKEYSIPEGATYMTFSTGSDNRIYEITPVIE
jgi:hypothetical protein